jgi:hypothetical protein
MSVEQASARKPPIGAIVMLLVAGFLYLGMMVNLAEMQNANTDAMGRGLASGFALVFTLAEWVALATMLLIGAVNGAMPGWAAITAALLVPLSGVAAIITLRLLDRGAGPGYQLVPGLLPPLTAGYALWARLPALHRTLPPLPTSVAAWGAVALLSLAPVPRYSAEQSAKPFQAQPQKSAEQILDEDATETRRQVAGNFRKLTPESPLWDWASFFEDEEFGKPALERARQLSHRQADAETALREGMGFPLKDHQALDLAATPALCAAASKFLIENTDEHQALDSNADFLTRDAYYLPYQEPIGWLAQSNCDLDDAVARLREVVGGFKQTAARDAYLGALPRSK